MIGFVVPESLRCNGMTAWATRWRIPPAALLDLLTIDGGVPPEQAGRSEAAVQSQVRVEASRLGWRVWRNNVGAFQDPASGGWVRFGLANDSAQVNRVCKSADLIGIRPVVITPGHVGSTIGQFVSLECKHAGWKWSGSEREQAQAAWAALVTRLGGLARIVTGPGGLRA